MASYKGVNTFADPFIEYTKGNNLWPFMEDAAGIIEDCAEQRQDEEIRKLQDKCLDFNERLKNLESVNYNVRSSMKPNYVGEDVMLRNNEQSMLTKEIIKYLTELYDFEDIRDQISCCVSISENTLKLLKMMPQPDANNYKKGVLHLFYQAIKRNYAKQKFSENQISLLLKLVKTSQSVFVKEEEYYELDEQLYDNNLDIFPEEE